MKITQPTPEDIYSNQKDLCCDLCGKNLLNGDVEGIFALCNDHDLEHFDKPFIFKDLYVCCKGRCDKELRDKYEEMGLHGQDWVTLDDLRTPSTWISYLKSYFEGMYQSNDLDKKASEKLKDILIKTYPYVAPNLPDEEKDRVETLMRENHFL